MTRTTRNRLRLVVGVVVAAVCCVWGAVVADVAAWASGAGCPGGNIAGALVDVTVVLLIAGGIPALVTGLRRIALVPFAIGASGPALILVALMLATGNRPDCP